MKIFGIIFSLLLTMISAALFGGFHRGMFSAHKSFGRLMSDVVSNVRQNIDCSIRSMQSVLDNGSPTPYTSNRRCNEQANQRVMNTHSNQHVNTASSDSVKVDKAPIEEKITSTTKSPKTDGPLVNKTIFDIISKQMAQRKLDEINNVLKNETDQLNNVNDLLKQKIDTIAKDVNEGLQKIEQDHKEPRIEEVIHEIELLREQKQNDSSKVDEVRQIAEEVLNKLDKNDTTSKDTTSLKISELMKTVTDLERYSNNTLKEIARQFKVWEAVESDQLDTIKHILERQQSNIGNETNNKPLTFKDISKNIFNGKSVYLNHTDFDAVIDNGAESKNTSQILKHQSVEVTRENIITYDPISLSTRQVGSSIINKGTVNNSIKFLDSEPYQKVKYTIAEKSVLSQKDVSRDKNTETIITSTEKGGTPDLLNAENHTNLDIDTGPKLKSIHSVLSDKGEYTSAENIQDNDLIIESIKTVANISELLGNISSVEIQAVTEIVNQITSINDIIIPSMSINMPSDTVNTTTESFLSTILFPLNDTNRTTESIYRLTNMVDVSNNMNSSYDIDKEPEPNNVSTIKSDISHVSSTDQPITTESFLSTNIINAKNYVANKSEPINTFMNTDDMSTMLSVEKYVVTENSFPTNEINITEIVENGSEFINTSTPMGNTVDSVTTEQSDSILIINKIDNYIPTTTESLNPSTNTDYMIIDTRAVLGVENLVTTENSFKDMHSNYNILGRNESLNKSIKYNYNTTTDTTTVENIMTTDNIADTNHNVKSNDDTIERAKISETSTNKYFNITDTLNVSKHMTIDRPISKNNLNSNIHITTTDDTPDFISSENSVLLTEMNHNIEIATESSVTSMNIRDSLQIITIENVTANYSRKDNISTNGYFDNETELITTPMSLDDMSNLSNVEKRMTTKYFLTSNEDSADIESSTNFSPVFTSSNTDESLADVSDVPSVYILVTTESNLAHKFNLSEGNADTQEMSTEKNLLTTENLISTTDINITDDIEVSTVKEIITSKKPNAMDKVSSNINIYNDVNSLSTSTNAYLLGIERNFSSEMMISTTDSSDAINEETDSYENMLKLENSQTAKYYLTTHQINVDFNMPTETIYASTVTENVLNDATDVPNINIFVTSENDHVADNIYSNDDTVEETRSMNTSSINKDDTQNVSSKEILYTTNRVELFNNFANESEFIDTSTKMNDIINLSNVEEFVTSENPNALNELKITNNIYKNFLALSTPTNAKLLQKPNIEEKFTTEYSTSTIYTNNDINQQTESFDDISDVSSFENLKTTEYYPTTNQINVDLNNPTETVYSSMTTDNVLVSASDLPSIDFLVTTEDYHSPDEKNPNDTTVEESESMDTSTYKGYTLDVSSEEIHHSANRVELLNSFSNDNELIDTSTNMNDNINLSNVEEFVTSEKPYVMNELKITNSIYKNFVPTSTPTNAELLLSPNIEEKLTTEYSTSTIHSNDDIKQKTEIFDDVSDMFSAKNLETTENYPTTNQINVDFNNLIATTFSSTTTDNVLDNTSDIPSIDILVTTENYHSPYEMNSNKDTVEESEYIDSPIHKSDDTLDVSSEENLVTTENLIFTNHTDSYDAIADDYDSIETSTSTGDIAKVSSVIDFLTSKRPHTINKFHSNYDISEETISIDSDTDDALKVSKESNLITSNSISTKSINFNIDKHTESIETSTPPYDAPSVELTATTKYYHSTEKFISKPNIDINTESTDILNTAKYRPRKKNSYKKTTKQLLTSTSSPEDLNLLAKAKASDQAVKLALNIFEQSRRSQSIMKNVFKNEKYATSLF